MKGSKLFFAKSDTAAPHGEATFQIDLRFLRDTNETVTFPNTKTGMIDLKHCLTVKSAELKAGKKNAIEVSTKEKTFYMFADTEKEKDEWIGGIGRSIVQSSATFTTDDNMHEDSSDGES